MAIKAEDYSHYHPPREPFSREEEIEMFRRFQAGNEEAGELLVTVNIPFVIDCAHGMKTDAMSLEDLIEEGIVGLIAAREKFDPSRGFKFISYAVWWIRQAMFSALNTFPHVVRLPLNQVAKIKKFHKAKQRLGQADGVQATDIEVLELMGEDPVDADWLVLSRGVTSLDLEPITSSEKASANRLAAAASQPATYQEDIEEQEIHALLGTAIRKLPTKRDRTIMCLYFGWPDGERMTLQAIGRSMHLTRERIRQLKDENLLRLQKYLDRPQYREALSR